MAQPVAPAKRPAHFDEDRDLLKRQRRDIEQQDRQTEGKRHNAGKDTPPPRERREKSPRRERDRSPGREGRGEKSYEREKPKRDREMPRGERERERDRDRDRERRGGRERDHERDRERDKGSRSDRARDEPARSRQPPTGPSKSSASTQRRTADAHSTKVNRPSSKAIDGMDIDLNGVGGSSVESTDDMETLLLKVMGFKTFRSTQNTKVPGNDKLYGVRKEKKTEYRQYMNRVGGFNRPLSPS